MKRYAPWLIVGAGVLWGTMGIFVRRLGMLGLSSLQIAAIRLTVAAAVFMIALLFGKKEKRKIALRDLGWFALTGFVSVFLMSLFYFSAISLSSMAVAAILLYTAPFFVLLASVAWLGETMTIQKGVALAAAFCGCVLVTGTGKGTFLGVVTGLLSALSYASYSIFGTVLLKKYPPLTVTAYSFLFAAAGGLAFCNLPDVIEKLAAAPHPAETAAWCLGVGIVTAAAPFALYTTGLRDTPAGKAAILAFVEPLVAAALGTAVFGEPMGLWGVVGIGLIVGAVCLLNIKSKETAQEQDK